MKRGQTYKFVFFIGAAFILAVIFVLLLSSTFNVYQTERNLQSSFSMSNKVIFPTFQYFLVENQTSGEPDISVAITVTYQGTLVAGSQTPMNLSAIAFVHSFEARNTTSIIISFQDALSYPPIAAQTFPANGFATLMPAANPDNQLRGSAIVYFPLEGNYSPTIEVIINQCSSGTCIAHVYLPRAVNTLSLQVQPTTRLEDEKIAIANLQLTFYLYVISLVGLVASIGAAIREASKYLNRGPSVTPEAGRVYE